MFFVIQNYRTIGGTIGLVWGIIVPFVLGAVIAFIVNIPMRFIENKLFAKWKGKGFVRPVSMVITLLLVALVVAGVMIIVIPQLGTTISQLVKSANNFLPNSSFISCQCLEAVILGTMFLVVLLIARMPYALLISVLIAFTALIPVVGAFIGCGIGAFLILMESPVKALIFIVIFLVLQQIEGNLVYPKVVGGSVGLPSMWVLVAVTVGSSLMGVAGMLFFIPLTSVIYSLVKEWTYERLEKKQIAANTEQT